MNPYPDNCARCDVSLHKVAHIMSKFNQDFICVDCQLRERQHPKYPEADKAEFDAIVRDKNYNFEGIGCPPELYLNREPVCLNSIPNISRPDISITELQREWRNRH